MTVSNRSRFFLLGFSFLVLSACSLDDLGWQRGQTQYEPDNAESLLAAEGSWNIVEEDTIADPSSLHSQARKKVDPTSMKPKKFIPESKMAMAEPANGQDVNFRLLRVEREVKNLRKDFRRLLPPLSNLIVADRELDKTIEDIQADSIQPASGISAPAPAPRNITKKKLARKGKVLAAVPSPELDVGPKRVKSLRLGTYPEKTRLVLDLSGPSKYSYDLDNQEGLLLIELPQAGWTAQARKRLASHPLIAGYTAQPSPGGGTTLALELKKPVQIGENATLKPNPTYPNHRIFLDIKAL